MMTHIVPIIRFSDSITRSLGRCQSFLHRSLLSGTSIRLSWSKWLKYDQHKLTHAFRILFIPVPSFCHSLSICIAWFRMPIEKYLNKNLHKWSRLADGSKHHQGLTGSHPSGNQESRRSSQLAPSRRIHFHLLRHQLQIGRKRSNFHDIQLLHLKYGYLIPKDHSNQNVLDLTN